MNYNEKSIPQCDKQYIDEPQKMEPELIRVLSTLNAITDTVANRVADFRQVNDSIFGSDPILNNKAQEYPHPEGLMPEIFYRLEKLFATVDLLMPEVIRISKLV